MISCIICSTNKQFLENVSDSVACSIGLPYELISIDNSAGKMGICEAYNKGAARAKFDVLCFFHEDVIFETPNWGDILLDHFSSLSNPGVLGVAGSTNKSLSPSGWWNTSEDCLSYNYRQSFKQTGKETVLKQLNNKFVREVICLDGLFLAVKRALFQKQGFDNTLPLFHGYDLDLCLAISNSHKNYFIPDIDVHHLSEGSIDDAWVENMYLLFKKWRSSLPRTLQEKNKKESELPAWQNYCNLVLASGLSAARKRKILLHVLWVLSFRQISLLPLMSLLKSVLYSGKKIEA